MSENPWTKKHPNKPKMTPTQVRKKLFAAGWLPHMVGLPVTDLKIRSLLLELCEANRRETMRRL